MVSRLFDVGCIRIGAAVVLVFLVGCATPEPRPPGVGRGINFLVTPLYPNSFEITAAGSRLRDTNELKDAWRKKAVMVANGRPFKVSMPPVVHDNESDFGGGPLLMRNVTGTITLTN